MKLYSIAILTLPNGQKEAKELVAAVDLSSFGVFQKGGAQQFMTFFSKTVAERTPQGTRQLVEEGGNQILAYNRGGPEQLIGVAITDKEYPNAPAFRLLAKVLDEFSTAVPQSAYNNPTTISFPPIHSYIKIYQDPKQQDSIMKVQQELDDTKVILHKTIESVLERGTKLDDLVDRSNQLSTSTKAFYKTAKKQNSCCIVM